jgi:hypothetical protein
MPLAIKLLLQYSSNFWIRLRKRLRKIRWLATCSQSGLLVFSSLPEPIFEAVGVGQSFDQLTNYQIRNTFSPQGQSGCQK